MLFLVVLFLLKNTSILKNAKIFQKTTPENGLTYGDMTIEDLVNKDADGDGIPDWQERLYGLDPTKKETTPGTPDSSALEKLRAAQGINTERTKGGNSSMGTENLTQTEKFSRELFATVAATSQNGAVDPATIDAISASLAEKIQNPVVRKVFLTSDIKIIKDDSAQAVKKYFNSMNGLETKYPIKEDVLSILQRFVADEDNVDSSVLKELDPAITQMQNMLNATLKIEVPQSLASLHLDSINSGERLMENISDMRLFDSDPIVALGAMSKFAENVDSFQSSIVTLITTISIKLNN